MEGRKEGSLLFCAGWSKQLMDRWIRSETSVAMISCSCSSSSRSSSNRSRKNVLVPMSQLLSCSNGRKMAPTIDPPSTKKMCVICDYETGKERRKRRNSIFPRKREEKNCSAECEEFISVRKLIIICNHL